MQDQELTTQGTAVEQVVLMGDLVRLTPGQRVNYYRRVCESLGLNYLTRPFEYITLNGKLTLYARRDATDQLRSIKNVSITLQKGELTEGVFSVTARATLPTGRTDEATGAVYVGDLKGEARANAIMKTETKAKRRVTLSIVGLGWLDETEVETVPGAHAVAVDQDTGQIKHLVDGKDSEIQAAPQSPSLAPSTGAEPPLKTTGELMARCNEHGYRFDDILAFLGVKDIKDYCGDVNEDWVRIKTGMKPKARKATTA